MSKLNQFAVAGIVIVCAVFLGLDLLTRTIISATGLPVASLVGVVLLVLAAALAPLMVRVLAQAMCDEFAQQEVNPLDGLAAARRANEKALEEVNHS